MSEHARYPRKTKRHPNIHQCKLFSPAGENRNAFHGRQKEQQHPHPPQPRLQPNFSCRSPSATSEEKRMWGRGNRGTQRSRTGEQKTERIGSKRNGSDQKERIKVERNGTDCNGTTKDGTEHQVRNGTTTTERTESENKVRNGTGRSGAQPHAELGKVKIYRWWEADLKKCVLLVPPKDGHIF